MLFSYVIKTAQTTLSWYAEYFAKTVADARIRNLNRLSVRQTLYQLRQSLKGATHNIRNNRKPFGLIITNIYSIKFLQLPPYYLNLFWCWKAILENLKGPMATECKVEQELSCRGNWSPVVSNVEKTLKMMAFFDQQNNRSLLWWNKPVNISLKTKLPG